VSEVSAIMAGMDVVAVVGERIAAFELGIVCQVFGLDRSDDGLPRHDFAVCGVQPGLVPTTSGFAVDVPHDLDRVAGADLVTVPAWPAIDACLHVVRERDGAAVANALARRMVVPAYLEGGQAQYVETPVPATQDHTLADLLDWMRTHLAEPLTVDTLAARAHLSPRTFARRFKETTGTTPHRWLLGQRLQHAENLLETTGLPVDVVATLAGFGSGDTLRHHFAARRGVSPNQYRRTFARV